MNIVEPIFAQCRNKPSELALCAPGTEFELVSYARLQRSLNNICQRIIGAGLAPGSRIGVLIDDPILHVMIVIALTRLGIVTVSGDQNVAWPIVLDGVIADRPHEAQSGKMILADAGWAAGDDHPVSERYLYRAIPDDVCRIFLTRQQRAIAFTHGMTATRLDRQKLFLGPRAPFCDRTHLDLPLTTALGFQVILGTLWRGGALVMTWDARKTLAAVAAYNIQNMVSTPESLLKLAELAKSHAGYRSQLVAIFCAARLRPERSETVRAHLCSNLTIGHIAGDRTMVASMPAQFASAIPGAVGYVMPGVAVEIVDEQYRALPPGQVGNVRIRSDYSVTEYVDDPSETQRAFRNGWFYPETRGQLTSDNMMVISGEANATLRE
jgi:acyl-CoA synthetase (AMP-forming)/AMP-acid ligase II